MDQSATPNRPSAADMALALDCVLVSDVLGAKSRLRGLLSYLVQQEINGRGRPFESLIQSALTRLAVQMTSIRIQIALYA